MAIGIPWSMDSAVPPLRHYRMKKMLLSIMSDLYKFPVFHFSIQHTLSTVQHTFSSKTGHQRKAEWREVSSFKLCCALPTALPRLKTKGVFAAKRNSLFSVGWRSGFFPSSSFFCFLNVISAIVLKWLSGPPTSPFGLSVHQLTGTTTEWNSSLQ